MCAHAKWGPLFCAGIMIDVDMNIVLMGTSGGDIIIYKAHTHTRCTCKPFATINRACRFIIFELTGRRWLSGNPNTIRTEQLHSFAKIARKITKNWFRGCFLRIITKFWKRTGFYPEDSIIFKMSFCVLKEPTIFQIIIPNGGLSTRSKIQFVQTMVGHDHLWFLVQNPIIFNSSSYRIQNNVLQ